MLQTQGRSLRITMVDGAQRPTLISRFVLSQAAQVIAFGIEPEDAKTLAGRTSSAFAEVCLDLRHHQLAWWDRVSRGIWIGMLNLKTQQLEGKVVQVTDTRRRRFALA